MSKAFSFVKYKWDEEKSVSFSCIMQTEHMKTLMNEAISLTDCDINQALSKFNECFEHAGECMKKTIFIGYENRKVWFYLECREKFKKKILSDNTCVSLVNLTATKIDLVIRKKEGNIKNLYDTRNNLTRTICFSPYRPT